MIAKISAILFYIGLFFLTGPIVTALVIVAFFIHPFVGVLAAVMALVGFVLIYAPVVQMWQDPYPQLKGKGSLAAPPARVTLPPAPPVILPGAATRRRQRPSPAPEAPTGGQPAEALRRLKDLRDQDLITEEEYQEKRKAILDQLLPRAGSSE